LYEGYQTERVFGGTTRSPKEKQGKKGGGTKRSKETKQQRAAILKGKTGGATRRARGWERKYGREKDKMKTSKKGGKGVEKPTWSANSLKGGKMRMGGQKGRAHKRTPSGKRKEDSGVQRLSLGKICLTGGHFGGNRSRTLREEG